MDTPHDEPVSALEELEDGTRGGFGRYGEIKGELELQGQAGTVAD